jgi:hypothetical protein
MYYALKPTAGEWTNTGKRVWRHVSGRTVSPSGRTDSLKWIVTGGVYDGYLFGPRNAAMVNAEQKPRPLGRRVRVIG